MVSGNRVQPASWVPLTRCSVSSFAENQQLTGQDSQRDSQCGFLCLNADLKQLIAAWDTLPDALKSAVLAIVSTNQKS